MSSRPSSRQCRRSSHLLDALQPQAPSLQPYVCVRLQPYVPRLQPYVSQVFTFSMHCGKNFPFRKSTSDLDLDLPPGTADVDYLARLREALPTV